MTSEYCPRCFLWHAPPRCAHDITAPCRQCRGPVGGRWLTDDGTPHKPADQCARCWQATLEAVA